MEQTSIVSFKRDPKMASKTQRVSFPGGMEAELAARLDLPPGPVRAYALFAHCFTCSKDILAAKRIAEELSAKGIAVLRFDFTGLGSSEGEFASTNFSSNVADLLRAADFMRTHYRAPDILIGHSLGGAAVLAAAGDVPEVKAVATIGAPADAAHVIHNFGAKLDEIDATGEAEVSLAGRPFTIRKQFLEDLKSQTLRARIKSMKKALMVLHSPLDDTVGIDNAAEIFTAAKHPKSFVSLDTADHLLTKKADAGYAAEVIAAWASRYIDADAVEAPQDEDIVRVTETGGGKFQNTMASGRHHLFADEPTKVGGLDSGPAPYDFLSMALGACTSMTLRLYADRKKLPISNISVDVTHGKVHAEDCEDCALDYAPGDAAARTGKIDRFERILTIEGDIDDATHARMVEIADKCPVHRTLEAGAAIVTKAKR